MSNDALIWWGLGFVGLAGSAMCSGLEVGMYSVNRVRLQVRTRLKEHARGLALLSNELHHPARVLTSLLILNNAFNYLGTLAITALLTMRGFSDLSIILLQAAVLTPVILVFAETIPKEVFRLNADVLMPRFSRVLVVARVALTWTLLLPTILALAKGVARVFGVDPISAVGAGRDRMAELLKYETGQLSEEQMTLVDHALNFEHARVLDVMRPMRAMDKIQIRSSRDRALRVIARSASRWIPVVNDQGALSGLISVNDFYRAPGSSIEELMTPPVRIASGSSVRSGLESLNRAGSSIGVISEGGKDIGLVTTKELIGPLLGSWE